MRITILCSSSDHPINAWLDRWINENTAAHEIRLIRRIKEATGGDLLFLISCSEIIAAQDRSTYRKTLVIHASALPEGRGWSPHIWQILEGKADIPVTLLEAEDSIDSGSIWHQITCHIPSTALWNEINNIIFDAQTSLMNYAVENFHSVQPKPQSTTSSATYYPRRKPAESQIDPTLSIADQFDKIRVSDPNRFPAFFKLRGAFYKLILEKIEND